MHGSREQMLRRRDLGNCDTESVTNADLDMAAHNIAHIRDGTEVGLEFTMCDLTDQNHRLRAYFHDDGSVELVVVHGPRCGEDAGEPVEVLQLSADQMDHFLRFAVKVDRIDDAVQEVARHLRDGRAEPETLATAAIASLMGVCSNGLLRAYLKARDG